MVYLTPEQKEGLARRARERRTKVAAEIRSAVDAYLAGITPQELELLDVATKRAKEDIDAMIETADEILRTHERFMKEIRKLRKAAGRA